jgi:intracellular septation protein
MQALSEFAPLLAFVLAWYFGGLYVATAVLMAGMVLLVAFDWLRLRRIPPMHLLSTVLVLLFGAATLLLHDKAFIQIKPTVFFWLASLAFLGSFWIGQRTLTERLLGGPLNEALGGRARVSAAQWRWLNLAWALFNALLGALNLVVVRYASERVWVALKPVDIVLMAAFVFAQMLWLATRHADTQPEPTR